MENILNYIIKVIEISIIIVGCLIAIILVFATIYMLIKIKKSTRLDITEDNSDGHIICNNINEPCVKSELVAYYNNCYDCPHNKKK